MSAKCGITMLITLTATSIRVRRGSGSTPASYGNGNGSLLSQYGMVRKVGARRQQVVQVGGAGAGQPRDHHRRPQFDVVDLGVPAAAGRPTATGS